MNILRRIKVQGLQYKTVLKHTLYNFRNENYILLKYYQIRNWGDAINPVFASMLTSKKIVSIDIDAQEIFGTLTSQGKHYLGVGSILQHANKDSIIWGSGLISPRPPLEEPAEIRAVRGPLTAEILRKNLIKCPDVYGDPILYLPVVYKPKVSVKKYKLGIVSHVVDWKSPLIQQFKAFPEVKLINMRKTNLILVDDINECERIASTSLHGLIISDAYGIPARWIKTSNLIAGNDFKFHDYHSSIRFNSFEPLYIEKDVKPAYIYNSCITRDVNIDLAKLIGVCPYI